MQVESFTLVAGQLHPFSIPGRFFMLIETGGPLRVRLFRNNSPWETATDVEAGYISKPADWRDPEDRFNKFDLLSATNQTVTVGYSDREGDYRAALSLVRVQQPDAIDTIADVTVSNVAVQLLPADSSRRKAMIVEAAGQPMRVGDANVLAGDGVRIAANGSITLDTTAAVYGIREGAVDALATITVESKT